jgi:hypothetical protein
MRTSNHRCRNVFRIDVWLAPSLAATPSTAPGALRTVGAALHTASIIRGPAERSLTRGIGGVPPCADAAPTAARDVVDRPGVLFA